MVARGCLSGNVLSEPLAYRSAELPRRKTSLAEELGARIVALRKQRGLTQEKLAWEAGLSSKGYLSRIESGERLPSLEVLESLASRLEVEVRDLFVFPDRGDLDAAMERVRVGGESFARTVLAMEATPPPAAKRTARRPEKSRAR